jgi:hypothetical protein
MTTTAHIQHGNLLAICLLMLTLDSGCATTYRPTLTAPGALTLQLTPEQCLALRTERRHYRATEQASGYVAGASALVTLIFLPLVGEKTAPALTSGVGLLAGGALAWAGAQVDGLDEEINEGCR